jgi:hypothetical protein
MVEQKPTNLFSSNTFFSLIIVVLSAAQPTIVDISKNGGNFEKYFNLIITLFGAIGISAEKLKEEKNVYTPKFFPFGRNPEEAKQNTVVDPVKQVTEKVVEVTKQVNEVANTMDKVESVLKNPLNLLKLR